MNISNDSLMPVCALRYALSRHSYVVKAIADEIFAMRKQLSDKDLAVMVRDIKNYLESTKADTMAHLNDFNTWQRLNDRLNVELEIRSEE